MMRKKIIIAIVFFLLLAAAFAVLLLNPFQQNAAEEVEEETAQIPVFQTAEENIVGAFYAFSDGETYGILKNNGEWHFADDADLPVIQTKAQGVAYDLANIYADSVAAENASDFAAYGLEPPAATVKLLLADGTEKVFYTGSRVQNSMQHYLRAKNSPTVYAVGQGKMLSLSYRKSELVYLSTQEIYKGNISEISIRRNDGLSIRLKQDMDSESEKWDLVEPYSWATDLNTLQSKVLNFVVGLSAVSYVTDKTESAMGLNSPRVTVELLLTDNSKHHFYIGNTDADTGNVFVRIDGVKYATLVNSEILQLTKFTKFDIIDRKVQATDYDGIETITAKGEMNFSFRYGKAPVLNGKSVTEQRGIMLYGDICELTIDGEQAVKKSGTVVQTLQFDYKDGRSNTFTVYAYDARNYAITKDGKSFFQIRKANYDAWKASVEAYLK